jgi:tetratricopeptide (TPR) repeat protein
MRLVTCLVAILSVGIPPASELAQKVDVPFVVATSHALQRNLTAAVYALHARILREAGELDRTIDDCTEAIRLNPAMQDAYNTRAIAWMKKGEVDRAIADWSEVIRLCPRWNAAAFSNRASAWMAKAEFDIAVATSINQPVPVGSVVQPDDSAGPINLAVGDFSSPSFATRAALERSRPDGTLQLRNVAFCEKIENYSRWTRFRRDEFTPGRPVLLYADVDHFTSEPTFAGTWRVVLKSTIEIFDKSGELAQRMSFAPNEDLCNSLRRDYYNTYEFSIPSDSVPGPHTLKLTIEDQLSGKAANFTVDFTGK